MFVRQLLYKFLFPLVTSVIISNFFDDYISIYLCLILAASFLSHTLQNILIIFIINLLCQADYFHEYSGDFQKLCLRSLP